MEQIRYLRQEEKQNTRQMYEAIFSEDSKSFIDYYYQWKTRDNQILVMEDNKGYEVMIHLNPYTVCINGKKAEIPYIVAVATRPDCRRKGKMQQVMKRALQDLQRVQCPFTFLLPADPAYYYGQDFVFSSQHQKNAVKCQSTMNCQKIAEGSDTEKCSNTEKSLNTEKCPNTVMEWNRIPFEDVKHSQMQQAAEIANAILSEQYNVYVQRDAAYYERLLEETASEHGRVLLIKEKEQFAGILAYGGEEPAEIKEFLLFSQYEERRSEICNHVFGIGSWKEEEMRMMIRIADLQSWDGLLKGEPEVLTALVTDSMVEANNGIWRLEWNSQGGGVTKLADKESVAEAEKIRYMDIAQLTEKLVEKLSIFIQEWV